MALICSVFFFLLCCSFLSTTDSEVKCDHYAAVGANWNVPLDYTLTSADDLRWSQGNKIVYRKFVKSVIDVDEKGFLKLTNLSVKDSEKYASEVFNDGMRVHSKSWNLCVLEPVQKPSVNMTCEEQESVIFTCRINEQPIKDKSVSVSWNQNNVMVPKAKATVLQRTAEDVETDSFTCNVSNRVSFAVSEPVTQTCYKSNTFLGLDIWVLVAGGGGIVVVLIVIVIVCCIKAKRARHRKIKDAIGDSTQAVPNEKKEEAELRLEWAHTEQQQQQQRHRQCAHPHNDHHHHHEQQQQQHPHHHHHEQQQQQHHHHRKQQQPAGHTGPRKQRSKPQPKAPKSSRGHPPSHPPSKKQSGQDVDTEQPPPLPHPRTKALRTQRV